MWRRPGEAGEAYAGPPVDLPRALYTNDAAQIWVRLDPPAAPRRRTGMDWEVSLELMEGDRPVALVPPGAPRLRVESR